MCYVAQSFCSGCDISACLLAEGRSTSAPPPALTKRLRCLHADSANLTSLKSTSSHCLLTARATKSSVSLYTDWKSSFAWGWLGAHSLYGEPRSLLEIHILATNSAQFSVQIIPRITKKEALPLAVYLGLDNSLSLSYPSHVGLEINTDYVEEWSAYAFGFCPVCYGDSIAYLMH